MRQRWPASRRKKDYRALTLEGLEPRTVLSSGLAAAWDSSSPWQNPVSPADLNADGAVSPLDALLAINALNSGLTGSLANQLAPPALHGLVPGASRCFLDADGDAQLTPGDPLRVINTFHRSLEDRADAGLPSREVPVGDDQPNQRGDDVATLSLQQGLARAYAELAPEGDVDVFRVVPDQPQLHAAVFPLSAAALKVSIVDADGNELGASRTLAVPLASAAVRDAEVTPGATYFIIVSGDPGVTGQYALQVINGTGQDGSRPGTPEPPVPAVATQFALRLPPNVPAGVAVAVHAVALDAWNQPVPDYAGTGYVTSSDPRAVLPAQVTFEQGHAFFEVTWSAPGMQTLTVGVAGAPSLIGTTTTEVSVAALATQFAVGLPPTAPAGTPVAVQVLALDARNQPVPGYSGTLRVTSSDPKAVFPAEVTFRDGHAVLQVTFATPGEQTLTLTDRSGAALAATATTKVAAPAVATQFAVRLPPHVAAGTTVPVQIVALNARSQPVSAYTGTVRVTSSDPRALLPAEVTFQDGQATVNVTFVSAGPHTLTIADRLDLALFAIAKAVVVGQPLRPSLSIWPQTGL